MPQVLSVTISESMNFWRSARQRERKIILTVEAEGQISDSTFTYERLIPILPSEAKGFNVDLMEALDDMEAKMRQRLLGRGFDEKHLMVTLHDEIRSYKNRLLC